MLDWGTDHDGTLVQNIRDKKEFNSEEILSTASTYVYCILGIDYYSIFEYSINYIHVTAVPLVGFICMCVDILFGDVKLQSVT